MEITQKQWIAKQLLENGSITRNKCLRNYISRLGAIMANLKEDGLEYTAGYKGVETMFGPKRDYEYTVVLNEKTIEILKGLLNK